MGRLLLRAVVGGIFVGHGTQKLFGWFGGPGLEGTAGFMESLGLRPGKRHAVLGSAAE
ncbi:MAG: DoxX family protein, partial [Gaiellaceae bacterium]